MRRQTIAWCAARNPIFMAAVFRGVTRYAAEEGRGRWRLVPFAPANFDARHARDLQGVLFSPAGLPQLQARVRRLGVPAVAMLNAVPGLPAVIMDDPGCGRVAAAHLMTLNRPLAYCGPTVGVSRLRERGFVEQIAQAGGVLVGGRRRWERDPQPRTLRRWLHRLPRPVGVLAMSDAVAADLLLQCRLLHLRVPEDVAIVGIDDDPMIAPISDPPLSTVDPGFDRIGYAAAQMLDRILQGDPPPTEPLAAPPVGVVPRASTLGATVVDDRVWQAMRYIREMCAEAITAEDVARAVALSRRALERHFRGSLDRGIGEEIRRARLDRARELLEHSDAALADVAAASGLGSASYLCQAFRRAFGRTPRAYRRLARTPGARRRLALDRPASGPALMR